MIKDDFYAEPTVFDHWQRQLGRWLCARFERLCPYGWAIGFLLLALVFLSIAGITALRYLHQGLLPSDDPSWRWFLAQAVTLLIAIVAAQVLFRQARGCWPGGWRLSAAMGRFLRQGGASAATTLRRAETSSRPPADSGAEVRTFLAGVRAAGVNVAIARALVAAGVRSRRQLASVSDKRLLAIRGVGPATVRKLRAHFGPSPEHPLQSSSRSR